MLRFSLVALSVCILFLAGCATSVAPLVTQTRSAAIQGGVHGGQQPVSGAAIQLWAVGSTGDGSASTPLLTSPVQSNAAGSFDITGLYTCPSASTLVYLTAQGGNPGIGPNVSNNALAMMTALGPCGQLASTTFISVNEVTTVGAIFALSQYMSSISAIGSDGTNVSDTNNLAAEFVTANEMVNTVTGGPTGPTMPAGFGVDNILINTIADILAACVNSAGGSAGDSTPCGVLFGLSGGKATTDTMSALLFMSKSGAAGSDYHLWQLISPNAPFQPVYPTNPSDYFVQVFPKAPMPMADKTSAVGVGNQTINLSDSLAGSTIYYTLDGSLPFTNAAIPYTGSIVLTKSATLKAIATAPGNLASDVLTLSYVLTPDPTGTSKVIAGNGVCTDGVGQGTQPSEELCNAAGLAFDSTGNLLISTSTDCSIRKLGTDGSLGYYAGKGNCYNLPWVPTTQLGNVGGLAMDTSDNLYLAEPGTSGAYCDVRRLSPGPSFSVWVGSVSEGLFCGYNGDKTRTTTELNGAYSLAFDKSGNLYIAEKFTGRIRKVTPAGAVATIAGTGTLGFNGDGVAVNAQLYHPTGVATDSAGNVYVADSDNNRIRMISGGMISTIAGTGTPGYNGDGSSSTVLLNRPFGVAVDSAGVVYIADSGNKYVRKLVGGTITTIAGTGTFSQSVLHTNNGVATSVEIGFPYALVVDSNGDLIVADAYGYVVRRIYLSSK